MYSTVDYFWRTLHTRGFTGLWICFWKNLTKFWWVVIYFTKNHDCSLGKFIFKFNFIFTILLCGETLLITNSIHMIHPCNCPANIYLLKVTKGNSKKGVKYAQKVTIKTQKWLHCCCSGVFIVNFEHILHFLLLLLYLTIEQVNVRWMNTYN